MYLTLVARFLLVIGGLNYLFMSIINVDIFSYLKNYPIITNFVMLAIGLSAAYFLFNRDYYLPFLGSVAIPVGVTKSTENLKQIKLSGLPPNTTVISWGSTESNNVFDTYTKAYGVYSNTDISKTDENGVAIVKLACPGPYYVPGFGMRKLLKRHIHYRYQLPKYKGLFSRVYTKFLDENCQ
jgi:hypothetical protein